VRISAFTLLHHGWQTEGAILRCAKIQYYMFSTYYYYLAVLLMYSPTTLVVQVEQFVRYVCLCLCVRAITLN